MNDELGELRHQLRDAIDVADFHHRMRNDRRWALAITYAATHGIPLSVFLGRVVEPGEPVWLLEDTQAAMGFEQWSAAICSGCGLHPLDWPDERDETWRGQIDMCHGCIEMADTRATIPDKVSDDRRRAMRVYLVPRPEPERLLLEAHERGEIDTDDMPGFT